MNESIKIKDTEPISKSRIERWKSSANIEIITYLAIFLFMLICNILTPMMGDDFTYTYSFAGKRERIESIKDIFISLKAHAQYMNGRLVAHFFAHLFLMMPPIVFDAVNSLVFTAQVFIICNIANVRKRRNSLMPLGVFLFIWLCQTSFGQVNLWLDGSCNYMWATFFGMLFLMPYAKYLLHGKKMNLLYLPLHLVISFMAGAWLENVSVGFIFSAMLFSIAPKLLLKRKFRYEHFLGIMFSFAGFVFMMSAPGEALNKASGFSFKEIILTFSIALGMLASLILPLALGFHLFRRLMRKKEALPTLAAAIIFTLGALASNFIMVFASYYPLRCSVGMVVMLIAAVALLYGETGELHLGKFRVLATRLFCITCAAFLLCGVADLTYTFVSFEKNEAYILECKENGHEGEIEVPIFKAYTKYSVRRGIKYLKNRAEIAEEKSINPNQKRHWPNYDMSIYYGVDSLIGVD